MHLRFIEVAARYARPFIYRNFSHSEEDGNYEVRTTLEGIIDIVELHRRRYRSSSSSTSPPTFTADEQVRLFKRHSFCLYFISAPPLKSFYILFSFHSYAGTHSALYCDDDVCR